MDGGFWDDIGIEAVAEIDRINVITVQTRPSAQILSKFRVLHVLPKAGRSHLSSPCDFQKPRQSEGVKERTRTIPGRYT